MTTPEPPEQPPTGPPGAVPGIAVQELTKRFGQRTVVDAVTFSVAPGTVVALLGPNGAGKTTTTECIAGLRVPDSGHVRVLGEDPRRQRATVSPRLGVMLQEGGLYQGATPREMLTLFAAYYPAPADPVALLDLVGLAPRARSRIRTLSSGERQRLNLALALVGRPRVLLLDEPTAGMDPRARHETWERIGELRAEGVAILLATHLLDEAERLADQVAILHQGRLLAFDTPGSLAAGDGLVVTTPATVDTVALAMVVGAAVRDDGPGRYRIAAGPAAIPAVSAWFAERGLPLHGVISQHGLEERFLRLTAEPPKRQRPNDEPPTDRPS